MFDTLALHLRVQQKNVGSGSQQAMPIGSRGVLVTCNSGWEHRASGEALALIEEVRDVYFVLSAEHCHSLSSRVA